MFSQWMGILCLHYTFPFLPQGGRDILLLLFFILKQKLQVQHKEYLSWFIWKQIIDPMLHYPLPTGTFSYMRTKQPSK